MPNNIVIKKGVDIKLEGEAQKVLVESSKFKKYALKPSDFYGVIPKMVLKEGEPVKAGDVLFYSKEDSEVKFVSPVSGKLSEIRRGEKRRILSVIVEADDKDVELKHSINPSASAKDLKKALLDSGCWPFIKQRPYDVIANHKDMPKAIFISAYATAPLAACPDFILKDSKEDFQAGIDALKKLTLGSVHLSVETNSILSNIKNAKIHQISGMHPAGNVGVQIEKIDPISLGERVWTVSPQHVAVIGKFVKTGIVNFTRIIALAGSEVEKPQYLKVKSGAIVSDFLGKIGENVRIISGNVLTGDKLEKEDALGFYHDMVTVIPEGNKCRMFGWMPFKDNNVPSVYGTSLYKFFKKKSAPNTNLNGEERAIVVTGKMESVMPMDIYPMQLLKECMANNIEKMEGLGIYEVAPEDFALIDYISTSKIEAQDVIRKGLDLMIKEVG